MKAGQLAPLVTAGALIPSLAWLAFLKPNLSLAVFAYRPSKAMVWGGVALLAISLAVQPDWISRWIATVGQRTEGNYGVPLLSLWGGPLLLLALARWKQPEARLLAVMACVPQSLLFYDQLLLGLVARSRIEAMILVILGFAGWFVATMFLPEGYTTAQVAGVYGPAILLTVYLPCLVMVLRRAK